MAKKRGADVLAEAMIANGIDTTMNIAGLGMWEFVHAVHSRRDKIRYVTGINETAIGLMAEGYGRATGKPALLCVYFSSGTQLASVALSTAWADRVPLIFMTMAQSQTLSIREGYAAVAGPATAGTTDFTKWGVEVQSAVQLPDVIARAVRVATAEPMGPVHISVPYNLMYEEIEEDLLDATAGITEVLAPPAIDQSTADRFADDLLQSERPVILAGGEVGQYGAAADLQAITEMTGAVVIGPPGGAAYMAIQPHSEHFAGPITRQIGLVDESDFLFIVGYDFTEVERYDGQIYDPAKRAAQLATSAFDIGKQVWPNYAAWGNMAESVALVRKSLEAKTDVKKKAPWKAGLLAARRERVATNSKKIRLDENKPMPLETLYSLLPQYFGDKLTIVSHNSSMSIDNYEDLGFDRYYGISSKASMQGWAVPAGIGIQMARPDERVVVICGDGGFMFTCGSLYTAARLKIPVTIIVVNNGGWGSGGYNFRIEGGDEGDLFMGGFNDPKINFAQIAEGCGMRSYRLDDADQVESTLHDVMSKDLPALIEVVVPPDTMRRLQPVDPPRTRGMSA